MEGNSEGPFIQMLTMARCNAMRSILEDVLLQGQNSATLNAAHTLLRILSLDKQYSRAMSSGKSMQAILQEKGFSGLWRSCSMGTMVTMEDVQRDCLDLTGKLVEVSNLT